MGCRKNFLQFHGGSVAAFAFVRGFHESKEFDGLRGTDRQLSSFVELGDFRGDAFVAHVTAFGDHAVDRCGVSILAGFGHSFVTENRRAIGDGAFANSAVGADASVFPDAGDQLGVRRMSPCHGKPRQAP